MTIGATAFRALVVPRLKQRFDISAALIATGNGMFSTETAAMERLAWRMGGSDLSPATWTDFSEWIAEQVLAALSRLERRQTIPGYQRDIIAAFAEQEAIITELQAENEQLRHSLALAFALAVQTSERS